MAAYLRLCLLLGLDNPAKNIDDWTTIKSAFVPGAEKVPKERHQT